MAASMITKVIAALALSVALGAQALEAAAANKPVDVPPAYRLIAIPHGVPPEVLYSVALQESGTPIKGQLVPWPWTLNVAGKGYRFATRSDACRALMIALVTNSPGRVDVGLGQTNIRANGHRYTYPCEGLDPHINLRVTATILAEQKAASDGSWVTAAGRYHRPAGGAPAARYREAFSRHLSRVTGTNLLVTNP